MLRGHGELQCRSCIKVTAASSVQAADTLGPLSSTAGRQHWAPTAPSCCTDDAHAGSLLVAHGHVATP